MKSTTKKNKKNSSLAKFSQTRHAFWFILNVCLWINLAFLLLFFPRESVCVCVCVCVRERERDKCEGGGDRETRKGNGGARFTLVEPSHSEQLPLYQIFYLYFSSFSVFLYLFALFIIVVPVLSLFICLSNCLPFCLRFSLSLWF